MAEFVSLQKVFKVRQILTGFAHGCLLAGLIWSAAGICAVSGSEVEKGRRIYVDGVLPSGALMKAVRSGIEVAGAQAACVSCHRPSGMGAVEGDLTAPPITGHYLYRTGDLMMATLDPRSGKRFNQAHDPYTDETLARAIRNGLNSSGQEMSVLMPRYGLSSEDLKCLTAYLKQLSSVHSPGVTSDVVQFATVFTPDVSAERRNVVIRMLKRMFSQKNGSTVQGKYATGRRHMVSAAEMVLGTERKWELNVWELRGAPETWAAQLDDFYRALPVFAMVSGVGGSNWKPVHDFCEKERIPCWFPSVDMPADTENRYTLYFQRGVMLEADILANYLRDQPQKLPARIVQYYWDDALGRSVSAALATAMQGSGVVIENRPLSPIKSGGLKEEMATLTDRDVAMFWLRSPDLSLFDDVAPPKATIYISGRLAGSGKFPLPKAWLNQVRMVYPYELPEKRALSLDYFHRWLRLNLIPLEDEPLQAEVYFALEYLTETMAEMLDNLYRDYMIERAENMLSRSQGGNAEHRDRVRESLRWSHKVPRGVAGYREVVKPEQETDATAQQPATNGAQEKGKSTTIYPRMSLAASQRFASKGAYVVRFKNTTDTALEPLSDWIVP